MARSRLFDVAVRFFSLAQLPVTRGSNYVRARSLGILGKLPGMHAIVKLAGWRSLPAFATKPLRDRVKGQGLSPSKISTKDQPGRATITVCYFAPFMTDPLLPQ